MNYCAAKRKGKDVMNRFVTNTSLLK